MRYLIALSLAMLAGSAAATCTTGYGWSGTSFICQEEQVVASSEKDDYFDQLCSVYPEYCNNTQLSYTTFTESGRSCDYIEAYWQARWDIDYLCQRLQGEIVNGEYSQIEYNKITTGACPDPDGGNGLGTLHMLKLRATCEHY